jgi:hypothetical protein
MSIPLLVCVRYGEVFLVDFAWWDSCWDRDALRFSGAFSLLVFYTRTDLPCQALANLLMNFREKGGPTPPYNDGLKRTGWTGTDNMTDREKNDETRGQDK